jgi:hypothetical protein
VGGALNSTIPSGNVFQNANFAGVASSSCTNPAPSAPAPLYYDKTTTLGGVFQPSFALAPVMFYM